MSSDFEYLEGGRESSIKKKDNIVYRPSHKWTSTVHKFLNSLIQNDFTCVPRPLGINDTNDEMVSFVKGDVHNGILPEPLKSDETLVSVANLMKEYHTASESFVENLTGDEIWMLPPRTPKQVICHGDFAPYNIVMENQKAVGIIDFDTIHPGPRIWDVAYAVYRWVPLMAPQNVESFGDSKQQIERLKLFLDTYGDIESDIESVLKEVVNRLESLVQLTNKKALEGDVDFQKCIEDGHHLLYITDAKYILKLIRENNS